MIYKPTFFIIGAPKCGTTALLAYLSEHPAVFMPPQERNFFSKDLKVGKHKNLDDYLSLFRLTNDNYLAIGEKSTWYLYSKEAIQNILAFSPEAKFIVMVRNPADMAYSLHSQFFNNDSQENIEDFKSAWNAQEDRRNRRRGMKIPRGCSDPKMLQYGEVCKLGEQLERLYKKVPRERVKVIFYDDLKNDTKEVYRDVLKFLGLPYDGRLEFPIVNKNKPVTFPRLRSAVYLLGKLKRNLGVNIGFGILTRIANHHIVIAEKSRPPLSSDFRKELIEFFKQDIKKLSYLTGRDLSGWLQ